MLPEPLVCTVVLMMYFIKWKNTSRQKDKINNSFAIFICVDPIWCGCGVKCAMPMYLLFVYLYFAAKLPNFKRNFLSHFCKKLPCFCAHMKAENMRIPKLSLLLHLGGYVPLNTIGRFFLDTLYVCTMYIQMYILWLAYPNLNLMGTGSTNSPVQLYFSSKYKLLEAFIKSSAPASMKNPFLSPLKINLSRKRSCWYSECLSLAGTRRPGIPANIKNQDYAWRGCWTSKGFA